MSCHQLSSSLSYGCPVMGSLFVLFMFDCDFIVLLDSMFIRLDIMFWKELVLISIGAI